MVTGPGRGAELKTVTGPGFICGGIATKPSTSSGGFFFFFGCGAG
eukprot:CAMPEP_0197700126 /NCGR_PEP_ID=MMETSP1338-20131121/121555_1 /TAXON_ID=43686 ORGANISM="Pelagodinium beii, Strain RCC1491" /NCGR_SAMPLE_ID=MMETSP1338 /ASSEMBLY_ACC=CAM_ASM_000754 /LENGTH=44 /DNA_ID= /DNA_START= /DNA_END= /DNA_ORIENTATION=